MRKVAMTLIHRLSRLERRPQAKSPAIHDPLGAIPRACFSDLAARLDELPELRSRALPVLEQRKVGQLSNAALIEQISAAVANHPIARIAWGAELKRLAEQLRAQAAQQLGTCE
jgi:hypothetical protein